MSVADLAAANHIKGEHIQAGQTLKVSLAAAKNAAPAAQAVKTVAKGGKAAEAKPSVPASYTVRKGDTLHAIAARYNLKLSEIKKAQPRQRQHQSRPDHPSDSELSAKPMPTPSFPRSLAVWLFSGNPFEQKPFSGSLKTIPTP